MLDTRDLLEKREDLKATILADFNERFPKFEVEDFDDIVNGEGELEYFDKDTLEGFREDFESELEEIDEIDSIENEIGSEFEYGVTLIEEDEFEDYCQELVTDCGYISKDFPSWIEIDWDRTADNMRADYSEVEYQGTTYLARI